MEWFKKNKWKVILPVVAVVILAGAFWYGGGAPGLQGWSVNAEKQVAADDGDKVALVDEAAEKEADVEAEAPATAEEEKKTKEEIKKEKELEKKAEEAGITVEQAKALDERPGGIDEKMSVSEKVAAAEKLAAEKGIKSVPHGDAEYSKAQGMVLNPSTGKDKYLTDPVPTGKPLPVEPQDVTVSDVPHTCTLSISCKTICNNMGWLDPEKVELVPKDGWILKPIKVTFYEGESVFNVLQRTCKQKKIHMEFQNTPMYNSAYIEGIHNLYEFDCGELSGWMYKVNGWFPNYGCSRYLLKEGDVICWEYTCDLGIDVGGYYSTVAE